MKPYCNDETNTWDPLNRDGNVKVNISKVQLATVQL